MCKTKDLVLIAEAMYKDTPVSIGFKFNKKETCLIAGKIEFNPILHRRDAWDVCDHFNLYWKQIPSMGDKKAYVAGSHCITNHDTVTGENPLKCVTKLAIMMVKQSARG